MTILKCSLEAVGYLDYFSLPQSPTSAIPGLELADLKQKKHELAFLKCQKFKKQVETGKHEKMLGTSRKLYTKKRNAAYIVLF